MLQTETEELIIVESQWSALLKNQEAGMRRLQIAIADLAQRFSVNENLSAYSHLPEPLQVQLWTSWASMIAAVTKQTLIIQSVLWFMSEMSEVG